jgi:hypothetical protein
MATGDIKVGDIRDATPIGFLFGLGAAHAKLTYDAPLGICDVCRTESNALMRRARTSNPDRN